MTASGYWIKLLLGLLMIIESRTHQAGSATAVQKFRVTPHDIQILEGTDTLLRCEVANRAGKVQWTKDGFALGFSAIIPGYPRYSVLVDAVNGVYNLQISNATIDDDAEYQCQVGPAPGNPAIRANARLHLIVAPSSIAIDGYSQNARVEVIEKQNLTLKCIVENAKPAAEIVWFRSNVEYSGGGGAKPLVDVVETHPKRFTTTSAITIRPRADDDFKDYSCQAVHKALAPDVPMRSTIQLSVLYPPGPPFFEGYSQGESLQRGQKVELACRSRGGNPPAQLIWYRNGVAVSSPQRTSGRLSENVYKFTATIADNGANLVCEAKNILSEEPLRAELNLTVLFAPSEVSISGPPEAKVGDVIQLTCTTAASNPPAQINWTVDGRQVNNSSSWRTVASAEGGWITVSNVTVAIEANTRLSTVAVCHALNTELTQNVVSTHTVNVLYPPSAPTIAGYEDGEVITSGSVLKLLCTTTGGNPLPTLTWYKNDKKLNAGMKPVAASLFGVGNSVASELPILTNASDNNARYKCEVRSPATDIPLFETKTLNVHFPPETVKIRVEPKDLHPNTKAKLICDSSSSNPPAKVSWWKDGIPVDGVNLSTKPGLWGGSISTLELPINVTQDMDGIVYTCQSINEVLQRSVHEAITLDILYPPKFATSQSTTFVGVEGEPLQISLVASANPMTMSFTWTKDGLPITSSTTGNVLAIRQRILSEGSILNISKLHRNDAGSYICEAMNSQGTATMSVRVIVEYPPTIESISNGNSFVAGTDGVLSCTINGRPLTADHVHWSRPDFDMAGRTTTDFANGTSYLHISNLQRSDTGNFTCSADNQRGEAGQRDVLLIVQSAPEIDTSPLFTRFAARTGDRGMMVCRARASPTPTFIWRRNGKDIKTSQRRSKFKAEDRRQIDGGLTFESIFHIDNVAVDDFGQYECVARNVHGQASSTLEFNKPSRPDSPYDLRVTNVTDNSVSLAWTAGFGGGLPVYYRIRYRQVSGDSGGDRDKYKYADADKPSSHLNCTISDLKAGATYVFSVMAANEAGGSKFLPDIKLTLAKGAGPISAELMEKDEMPNLVIIGITSAAMVLLVLNAALVAWFVIRRQNKESAEAESPNDDVYSKDDNQSVYKISINSLQGDASHKKAASTYLVENVDIIQSTSYPPKYQESSMCSPPYQASNHDYTRTLPNPKRQHNRNGLNDQNRSKDDHMLVSNGLYIPAPSPASSLIIKGGSYMSSPSPAPPPDGSYFNMSDKYISYPPVVY